MHKLIFLLSFAVTCLSTHAQSVVIQGYAPGYIGKTIQAYGMEDYVSQTQILLASSTVQEDSTFSLTLESDIEQKIILKSDNNSGFILVQPNANYSIFFPDRNKYTPFRPSGNDVEVSFLSLDSTDINYKVLGFQRWVDHFLGNNYHLKSVDGIKFSENLDRFKSNAEKAYKDDPSIYLKAHVRFTLAGLDNISTAAERNRYEKYDFYIRNTPVYYNCETYMTYINDFYQQLIPRLSNETNQAVYEAILHSSPTMMMHALGSEYTLSNLQIRELIMLTTLTEAYHSVDFPETNVITILDSLSHGAVIAKHRIIAKNLKNKLTKLVPGGKAPALVMIEPGKETKTLQSYKGKHVYIHFMDPKSKRTEQELPLLKEIYERYQDYVHFVSIYKKTGELADNIYSMLDEIPWDTYALPESNAVWKNYQINAFPQYTLIDATGYVVASPALSPTPNGQYQTIDEVFYQIKSTIERQ